MGGKQGQALLLTRLAGQGTSSWQHISSKVTYREFGLHYAGWHSISVDASVEIMRVSEKPVSARSERKSASVRSQPPITNISSSIRPEGWAAESATLSMRRRVPSGRIALRVLRRILAASMSGQS